MAPLDIPGLDKGDVVTGPLGNSRGASDGAAGEKRGGEVVAVDAERR